MDYIATIIDYFVRRNVNVNSPLLDTKKWEVSDSKYLSESPDVKAFENIVTSNIILFTKEDKILNVDDVSLEYCGEFFYDFINSKTNRDYIKSCGRNIFNMSIKEFNDRVFMIPDDEWKAEEKDNFGFLVGDIIMVKYFGNLRDAEFEIVNIDKETLTLKMFNKNSYVVKETKTSETSEISKYGKDFLCYATLVTPVGNRDIQNIDESEEEMKSESRKENFTDVQYNKYKLEIIDTTEESADQWMKELYEEDNVNIIIAIYDDDVMCDQDVPDVLPELLELNLGEVQISDNGWLGLTTKLSVAEIKSILKKNNL